ncbi:sugar phosphate isomerase/epimerase [Cohnella endophytica]|uniref:Sugar phosphate isomerase/epimerase n=1 Tax=Cohnella endophytica TaxID=2419778 RepID=A0A494XQJ7_9BACL|nr:sugar phosphate isomerase/epimerase family protein [Cohnella endophytica]RKP52905.1 sugar phosphate isomerase/epimerase [Cohnella endophytica]
MLKGLTRAGIGELSSDKQFIELASKYGFQSVEVDAEALINEHGLKGAQELLETNGMVIGSVNLPVEWRNSEQEFLDGLTKLTVQAQAAVSLSCRTFCTYILPSTNRSPAEFAIQTIRRLRLCAQIIGGFGIKLGIEFVGPHHWRTAFNHPFIYKLEDTLALIDAIGCSNVGLLLDSYHWHSSGLTTADIDQLSANQIVYVHINDAKALPIEQLLDNDRLYPGEGVIDLVGFLRSLQRIGYQGVVAQEVIVPNTIAMTAEDSLIRSQLGFERVFSNIEE